MSILNFANDNEANKDEGKERGRPFGKLLLLMMIGIIGIIIFSLQYWDGKHFVQATGVGVTVAGASMLIGGLLGFLFGIPRSLQQDRRAERPAQSGGAQASSPESGALGANYQANTNLEQISDWLTKILVGVGLIEVKEIYTRLQQIAGGVASGMGIPENNPAFPLALILFFLVCGFLFCYLWTRFFLPKEFTLADRGAYIEWTQMVNVKLETALRKADAAQSSATLGIGKQGALELGQKATSEDESLSFDPLAGKFGGQSSNNDRQLMAKVSKVPGSLDIFSIQLTVSSTDQKKYPLTGEVRFFLHPTFRNDRPIVQVGPNGVAELRLTAWGAFTVGAIADNGNTQLELNLAGLTEAPPEFRTR